MAIVSSTYTTGNPQQDGRFWVHEVHTDQLSIQHLVHWLASASDNLGTILANRATQIGTDLVAAEIAADLALILANGSQATGITLNYATFAQAGAAVRAAYQASTQMQAIMLGDYLSTLTSTQLQSLFSLTAGQVTTLMANKLTPAATQAAAIRAASGA